MEELKKDDYYLTTEEILINFDTSKRTLERKIKSGEIDQKYIKKEKNKRTISYIELVRVFGEPRGLKEDLTAEKINSGKLEDIDVICLLKEQLKKAEQREQEQKERGDRLEDDLRKARENIDAYSRGMFLVIQSQNSLIEERDGLASENAKLIENREKPTFLAWVKGFLKN